MSLLLALPGRAQEPAAQGSWRVWLEPKFMRAAVASPVPASQKTEIAAGVLSEEGLQALSRADFDALGATWDAFYEQARTNAAEDLKPLKPAYVRNRKTKVIEYAVLRSDKPTVAAAVLAPKFLDLFQDTLGPKVLVVLPNRFTAYVFPALASSYQDYAPMVLEDYRATAHPVSKEVFEFSAAGIRAVGAYEEP